MDTRRHDHPFEGFGKRQRISVGRVLPGEKRSNAAQGNTIDIARSLARRASEGQGADLGWSHPRTSGAVAQGLSTFPLQHFSNSHAARAHPLSTIPAEAASSSNLSEQELCCRRLTVLHLLATAGGGIFIARGTVAVLPAFLASLFLNQQ